jgi:hypothetical protein
MGTKVYVFEGGTLTAASVLQGTVVATGAKRVIRSAEIVNDTGAGIIVTVVVKDSGGTDRPKISARTIDPGETYLCPELVNKGLLAAAGVYAVGNGAKFSYTATEITNG